jgi:Trypsin
MIILFKKKVKKKKPRQQSLSSQVATPFKFSDNIQGVNLPSQNQDTEGGTDATVAGWGYSYVIFIIFIEKSAADNIFSV